MAARKPSQPRWWRGPLKETEEERRARAVKIFRALKKRFPWIHLKALTMVEFDSRFEIMPGTHSKRVAETHNPYEAVPGNPIAE